MVIFDTIWRSTSKFDVIDASHHNIHPWYVTLPSHSQDKPTLRLTCFFFFAEHEKSLQNGKVCRGWNYLHIPNDDRSTHAPTQYNCFDNYTLGGCTMSGNEIAIIKTTNPVACQQMCTEAGLSLGQNMFLIRRSLIYLRKKMWIPN